MLPGVYLRKQGGKGGLKPVLVFVRAVRYRRRLDWFGIAERTIRAELPNAAVAAVKRAMETAR